MIYLDTSALLKLYVEEAGRELVREAVGTAETVATSTIAYAEARAGLARRLREKDFTEEEYRSTIADLNEDWTTYDRLNVSDSLSHLAGELAERHALRGYDSVHLASAVRLSGRFENLHFLAFDEHLSEAAREVGLVMYGDEAGAGSDGRGGEGANEA